MASDEDPISPLEIFPIEVWEKIFTYLKGRDLFSCYRTDECWRQELEKQKNEFLMSEVFPLISHSLSRQDVLNSRLVCSSWKDSVEDHLQHHPSQFNVVRSFYLVDEVVNPRLLHSPNDLIPRNLNFSWESWRHENLLLNVPEGCTNPFPNRHVSYSEMGYYPENERRAVYTQILERFGTQVWHFRLAMRILEEGPSTNANTLYQLTRSLLLLMPNLKSRDLYFEVSGGSRIDKSEYLMTPEKEELIRSQPLPPLNDLMTLKLRGLINPLESAVWQHYGHVQKMCLEKEHRYSPLFQGSLENVHMDRLEELHFNPLTLEDVRNMSMNFPWPLRILSLDFSIITEDGFELVFRTISHFGATLRHLGMRLDSRHSTSLESLDLPHLETLKLRKLMFSDKGFINSLGFLQTCTSLKILELSSISQYSLDSLAPLLLCPLRTLRLELDEDKDLWMVLATVSQLGATLRHLELNGQCIPEITEEDFMIRSYLSLLSINRLTAQTLALPRLETLSLRCGRLAVDSLDFLQECTSLRKLVLTALYTDLIRASECNQVIQFRGYFARINESNIWGLLPDLKLFELNMRPNVVDYKHHEPVPDGFFQDRWVSRIYTRNGYSDVLLPPDEFW